MRAFLSTAVSSSVILIVAMLNSPRVNAGDETASDVIAKISQNANKWRSHFATLNLKYKMSHFESWRKGHPDKTDDEIRGCYIHYDLIWTDQASLRLEWAMYRFGKLVKRMIDGCNGQESFSASYIVDTTGVERLTELRIVPVNFSRARIATTVVPMEVLWSPVRGKWLDELITEFGAELHSTERNSDPIADIQLQNAGHSDGEFYRVSFDAERNFLPRSCDQFRSKKPNNPGLHWECSEWREIQSGVLFPWKGTHGTSIELQDWEVEEVRLNVPVKTSLFVAPQPIRGTKILDGRTGQLTRFGADASRAQRAADSKSLADQNLKNSDIPAEIPQADGRSSVTTIIAGGLAISSTLLWSIGLRCGYWSKRVVLGTCQVLRNGSRWQ